MVKESRDSDSDAGSFHSFDDDEPKPPPSEQRPAQSNTIPDTSGPDPEVSSKPIVERFPAEEEAKLLAESNSIKSSANQLFGTGSYENAIQSYDRALSACPNYLDYEMAVLRSNVAACHLKLQEWKEAVESATKGVECLERLEPLPSLPKAKNGSNEADKANGGTIEDEPRDPTIEEVDDSVEDRIAALQASGHTLDEVRRLQIKLLLRRGKGRAEQDSWSTLQGADEDYRLLLTPTLMPSLSSTDRQQVITASRTLGPRLTAAREREMGEMMDKLKGLGNSILKPFGLSTNNFQFVKDEQSGGYSMNFNQNAGKK